MGGRRVRQTRAAVGPIMQHPCGMSRPKDCCTRPRSCMVLGEPSSSVVRLPTPPPSRATLVYFPALGRGYLGARMRTHACMCASVSFHKPQPTFYPTSSHSPFKLCLNPSLCCSPRLCVNCDRESNPNISLKPHPCLCADPAFASTPTRNPIAVPLPQPLHHPSPPPQPKVSGPLSTITLLCLQRSACTMRSGPLSSRAVIWSPTEWTLNSSRSSHTVKAT